MRLGVAAVAICLGVVGVSAAQNAAAAMNRKPINIPAQPLSSALEALAKERDLQVIYRSDLVGSVQTSGAVGVFTSEEALTKLLAATGLTYRYLNETTVTILPASSTSGSASAPSQPSPATPPTSSSQKEAANSGAFLLAQAPTGQAAGATSVDQSIVQNPEKVAGLQEVVVTAQRRAESIEKVPMSIAAFNQTTLDELHIQSFSDLASVVPGLVLSTPQGLSQAQSDVAIRGIFSGGNAATTGIYIDETPIVIRQNAAAATSGSPLPDIFDLERIEVLRGPQGTLFGAGAMGGAIRYITPQPSLENASGFAKVEFGITDRGAPSYDAGVAYGTPVVQGYAAFRLSGWLHSDGGYIDIQDPYTGTVVRRNANSSNSYVLRPAFTVAPTEALTITPAVFFQHRHSDEPDEYWATGLPNPEAGAHVSGFGATVSQPATDDLTVASLAVKFDFKGMSFQSDTSYTHRSYNALDDWSTLYPPFFGLPPLPPALASFSAHDRDLEWTRAWQQEFRLASKDSESRLSWVVGAYYRHALDGLSQLQQPDLSPITELAPYPGCAAPCNSLQYFGVPDYVINGQSYSAYSYFTTVTEQEAAFGELAVKILPRLKANIGLRIERAGVIDQLQIYGGPLNGDSTHTVPDEVQTPITPRFGLSYQVTDSDMVYATAAKGYRTGGSNFVSALLGLCQPSEAALGITSVPATFGSDTLWSYEIGTKDSFFDRRLALQASAYYIDWTGIQTAVVLPSCGASFTANRGKAISQGFDLQLAVLLTAGLTVSANVGYTDAYYPDAAYAAPSNGVVPLLNGAGDKLPGVPPWSAAAHVEYSFGMGHLWSGAKSYARVDYRWLDAYPSANPNVATYDSTNPYGGANNAEAYGVLNLRFGVIRGGLDVSAYVDNATHANPLLGYSHVVSGSPLFYAAAIRPLTAGVTAFYRF